MKLSSLPRHSVVLPVLLCVLAGLSNICAAPVYRMLHSLGNPDKMGHSPSSPLLQGPDGTLYGLTSAGGRGGNTTLDAAGTLYTVNADGGGYRVLHHFGMVAGGPYGPSGRMVMDADGFIYGTSRSTASSTVGSVWRIHRSGVGGLSVLHNFTGPAGNDYGLSGLILGSDGMLYGAARAGGANGGGTLYRINRNGTGFTVLHDAFLNGTVQPSGPSIPCEGSDGMLYGTSDGGANRTGTIWRMRRDGTGFTVLRPFSNNTTSAKTPVGGVIESTDGMLYGVTRIGGTSDRGALYRINRDGTGYQVMYNFTSSSLNEPDRRIIEGADGLLYGVAAGGAAAQVRGGIFRIGRNGAGFQALYTIPESGPLAQDPATDIALIGSRIFGATRSPSDGTDTLFRLDLDGGNFASVHAFSDTGYEARFPYGVWEGPEGRLYVAAGSGPLYFSTVSRLRRDGSDLELLRQFGGQRGEGGRAPSNGLTDGGDGWLYGATILGGAEAEGTLMRMDPRGAIWEEFYSMPTPDQDVRPYDPPLPASDGWLYGTTTGIENGVTDMPAGSIFRIARDGTGFTTLKRFPTSGTEGLRPGKLIEASDGRLYGITGSGGSAGRGTIFRIHKDGTGFQTLRHFTGSGPRNMPHPLTEASDGMLYGTSSHGGSSDVGTLFRLNKDGSGFTVLRSFSSSSGQPNLPYSSPLEGADGRLYGVLLNTGSTNRGTIYSILKDGSGYTVHYTLGSGTDGVAPQTLIKGRDGLFYGVTFRGGEFDYGTIFSFGEAPEITVTDAGGATLTAGVSGVQAGTVRAGFATILRFTVRNTGQLPLNGLTASLHGATAGDFTVVTPLPATIAPGAQTVLEVRFSPPAAGERSATLTILSNDYDEGTFAILLSGKAVTPEIAVHDGPDVIGPELQDGQTQVVDYGTTRQPEPVDREFTVRNTGTADLRITNIDAPDGFSVVNPPAFPLTMSPGNTHALRIRLNAAATGTFAGNVTIASDDLDEELFDFPVAGTVVSPEIVVHDGAAVSAPQLTDGQAALVDFGRNVQGMPGTRAFTISNTGTAELLVSEVTVPAGYNLLNLPTVPFTVGAGQTASFQISLTTLAVGAHTGSVVISSDDLDETAFDFPITGEVFIPNPVATVPASTTTLNRQTGLREQTIHLTNDTTATVPAYNLIIRGLPDGVEVNNASSRREDGSWVVYVRQAMTPHSAQDILLEYFSPNRGPGEIAPQLSTEVVLNPPDLSVPGDAGFAIDRVLRLEGGAVLIEFPTTPGRQYQVQYSHDGTNWQASLPNIRAAANRTQWTDRGLPRTDSHPSAHASRFYRVAELVP